MENLKKKYTTVILNTKSNEHKKITLLGESEDAIFKRDKRLAYPCVYLTNAEVDEILFICKSNWKLEKRKCLKEIKEGLEKKLKERTSESSKKESVTLEYKTWTNSEGKKIKAAAIGIEGDKVEFKLTNQKTVKYPLEKLSKESQQAISELFAKDQEK